MQIIIGTVDGKKHISRVKPDAEALENAHDFNGHAIKSAEDFAETLNTILNSEDMVSRRLVMETESGYQRYFVARNIVWFEVHPDE